MSSSLTTWCALSSVEKSVFQLQERGTNRLRATVLTTNGINIRVSYTVGITGKIAMQMRRGKLKSNFIETASLIFFLRFY